MAPLKNWIFSISRFTSPFSFDALASPRIRHACCLTLSILGVIGKFWLIAQTEIQDATDDPCEYVLQILYPVCGGLGYPPGTGLVGLLFYKCGIPFRLGIEACFIFAAALVLRALLKWPHRSYLSLGLFLFMIFNPNPTELFSHLMSDQVWLVETMVGLSCLVLAMENEDRHQLAYLSLTIFFLGLTTITRSTFVPLMASLVAFVGLSLVAVAAKFKYPVNRKRLALLALSTWTLLFGVGVIYEGTCVYDVRRYGYFGVSAIDCREYKTLYTCLQSVGDPGDDTYFPVDENRRKLIQRAGPVSHWLVGELEKNTIDKQVGIDHYGKADIPTGWFHFAVFNAVLTVPHMDLRKSYALFETVENEIAEANRQGRLKVRFVLPLPDSRLRLVWAAFPRGLENAVRATLYQPPPEALAWQGRSHYKSATFSQALTRRTVQESPTRNKIGVILCAAYARVYTVPLFLFGLSLFAAFAVVLARKWRQWEEVPLCFLVRQVFVLVFLVHFFWYALFDASGLYVFTRYMVYQNVMLPLLIAYYLVVITRLLKTNRP